MSNFSSLPTSKSLKKGRASKRHLRPPPGTVDTPDVKNINIQSSFLKNQQKSFMASSYSWTAQWKVAGNDMSP